MTSPMRSGIVRAPGGHPATWVATGRSGGVSVGPFASLNLADHVGDDPDHVIENRARVNAWLGVPADRSVVLDAAHGAQVHVADGPGIAARCDAAVTTVPGLALLALGGDCVMVALACGRAIAVIHCGWIGLQEGVVAAGVAAVRAAGGRPEVVAVLGPSICGSCYPVPPERAAQVRDLCAPEVADAALLTCPDGQPGIDVAAGVCTQLAMLDVVVVSQDPRCTAQDAELFSHRAQGRTGRQGLGIVLMADDARTERA